MKRWILGAAAALGLIACSEKEEVFYSAAYPVTKIEVAVEIDPAAFETPTPAEESDEDGGGAVTPNPAEEYAAELREEVAAAAPVKVGGAYFLEFSRFDGGELSVVVAEGTAAVNGTFTKQPGAKEIVFLYGDEEYTATISTYRTEDGAQATLLSVDLTKQYQELYPDKGILTVIRMEYTSHRE